AIVYRQFAGSIPGILEIAGAVEAGALRAQSWDRGGVRVDLVDLVALRVQDWIARGVRLRCSCGRQSRVRGEERVERQLAAGDQVVRLAAALVIVQKARLVGMLA